MPSLGFGEILVILVLALIIFGPKRLPEMGRTIGRSLKEFRRAATDLRSELEVDLDEPPKVSAEQRARRPEKRDREPAPPRGEAPPT
ncbi:MAG: Sec-independent protein translocase subunit TatA/TatB [Actinomycetota bacterium]